MKVLIVVASQTGRTEKLAEAVAEGVREAGAEAEAIRAEEIVVKVVPSQVLQKQCLCNTSFKVV